MSATPDPRDFLPLHPFELRILLALLDGPRHGYRIVKAIEKTADGRKRIFPANLYRRIRDLTGKGLIAETEAPAEEQEPRRRYFRITALGEQVARAEARRLETLLREVRAKELLARSESLP
jgi:DNA-binding PadR family transcriptional regulator